jgi:hypothetical protein
MNQNGLLCGVIGCYSTFPEPRLQRRANTIFRDTNPQFVRADPECARHRLGKAFVSALDEAVVVQVAAGSFEPEPCGAKSL